MIHIKKLTIYPIKSCGGIALERLNLSSRGMAHILSNGIEIHDREWMIINHRGQFLTQRELPKMLNITLGIENDSIILSHPCAQKTFKLLVNNPLEGIKTKPIIDTLVWGDQCQGYDEGAEVSAWLTNALGLWQGEKLRLIRFNPAWQREVLKVKNSQSTASAELSNNKITTHFSDSAPYLISNEASLDALNQELKKDPSAKLVTMQRFRANIEISGCSAWEEHQINVLKERTKKYTFTLKAPCSRCKIITIDPATADIADINQPIHALRLANPHYKNKSNTYFGQKATLVDSGSVTITLHDELVTL